MIVFALMSSLALQAQEWPQFRGPHASGKGTGKTVTDWNMEEGKNILYKVSVPGLAHSSPIIVGGRIYLTTAVSEKEPELKLGLYGSIESVPKEGKQEWRLLAFERATGKLLFNRLGHTAVPRAQRHPKATQCNSTPASDGRFIVTFFGSEGLFCFDMEGRLQWHKDLGAMNAGYFKMPKAQWGFASSPVIHEGHAYILCDVQEGAFVGKIKLATGEWVWKTKRNDVPTWTTPTVAQVGEKTHILINGWKETAAYESETGERIWWLSGGGDIPVPTPIVGKNLAYFTSAHGRFRPMRAVRLSAKGEITPPEVKDTNEYIAWVHHRQGNYMQTPLLLGENILACNDRGNLTCFDAKDGTIHFSERLSGSGFTASLVSDGSSIYVTSEFGDVWVVKNDRVFEKLARLELGDSAMATPAICDGILYFRTRKSLIAIGEAEVAAAQ